MQAGGVSRVRFRENTTQGPAESGERQPQRARTVGQLEWGKQIIRERSRKRADLMAEIAECDVLQGVVVYLDGFLGPYSNLSLNNKIMSLGGRVCWDASHATHVVCTNLAAAKRALIHSGKDKRLYVLPEWVVECERQGTHLRTDDFLLITKSKPSIRHHLSSAARQSPQKQKDQDILRLIAPLHRPSDLGVILTQTNAQTSLGTSGDSSNSQEDDRSQDDCRIISPEELLLASQLLTQAEEDFEAIRQLLEKQRAPRLPPQHPSKSETLSSSRSITKPTPVLSTIGRHGSKTTFIQTPTSSQQFTTTGPRRPSLISPPPRQTVDFTKRSLKPDHIRITDNPKETTATMDELSSDLDTWDCSIDVLDNEKACLPPTKATTAPPRTAKQKVQHPIAIESNETETVEKLRALPNPADSTIGESPWLFLPAQQISKVW